MLYSVCVGVNEYEDTAISNLNYARADAEAVSNLFRDCIDKSDLDLHLLVDSSASKANVMELIGEYLPRVAKSDDIVVLFFAGHGSPESESSPDKASRYLILNDTHYDSIFSTGLNLESELNRLLARIYGPALILCFFDTCFSGRAGGRTFEGPQLASVRTRRSGIKLEHLSLGEGRMIMTACDDDQLAFEDSKIGQGIFTSCLLDALRKERGNDKAVTITALFDEIDQAVRLRSNDRQTPILNGRTKGAKLPVFHKSY